MQTGRIAYAGKYSAPDYERILTAECGLAVENTMIYHTPEVKEQLERFGIPVLVERSSYESSPLARMEWIKLYGILLGKEPLPRRCSPGRRNALRHCWNSPPPANAARFSPLLPAALPLCAKAETMWRR